jgi:1,2-diacylglycerol 3-alpha-glucosyltransferase
LATDNYVPSRDGVTSSLVGLANGLGSLNQDVGLVCPRTRVVAGRGGDIHLMPSVPTGFGDWRMSWASQPAIERVFRSFMPDVVHIQTLGPVGMAAAAYCRRAGVRCVLTWHTDLLAYSRAYPILKVGIPVSCAIWALPGDPKNVLRIAGRTLASVLPGGDVSVANRRTLADALAFFDYVIVPSRKAALSLPSSRAKQGVRIVPSAAIPRTPLRPPLQSLVDRIHEWVPAGRPMIAFVGRLSPEKNLAVVLRTMAREVLSSCPDAILLVIGDGPLRSNFERMAVRLGIANSVFFVGGVPREIVQHILIRCAVIAHPSMTETQGLVLWEAALVGVPAVVMDPDLDGLVSNGVTGYVAQSEPAFGAMLARLIAEPALRASLGVHAKQIASAYSPDCFAGRILGVYREALNAGVGKIRKRRRVWDAYVEPDQALA